MKKLISKLILLAVNTSAICILLILTFSGCVENQAASAVTTNSFHETLVSLAFDQTQSFDKHRKLDTNFVAAVCHPVSITGGLITVHGIGEPTDQSGLRCYLKPVPVLDNDLVLSKQAELKQKITGIAAENERHIHEFLKKVQAQIFEPMNNPKQKVVNTDINGFFKKAAIILDEPVSQNMKKIVFCYSDGIQSMNGKDSPACFNVKPKSNFLLCLSGWKTKLPGDFIEIKTFEDPEGFLQFLYSINSSTN